MKGTSSDSAILIDLDKVKHLGQQVALYWIKPLGLKEEDRKHLVTGDWLSDNHISAVLKLLKKQYPHQNGLQSTQLLAKNLQWQASNTGFVQILHISANHWVCASNVFSPPGVCDVYDSMPATYSSTLIRQVAAMMKTLNPSFTLRYTSMCKCRLGQVTVVSLPLPLPQHSVQDKTHTSAL